jgi:acyl-CoA thioester hydrolase
MTKKRYTCQKQVQKEDIDQLNHVNNVVYVKWIQEAAETHWNSVMPEENKKQYIWVIVRHEIDYHAPARLGDTINIETWVLDATKATSHRAVRFTNAETGKLLVESKTNWCMLNARTFRPARITKEITEIFLQE